MSLKETNVGDDTTCVGAGGAQEMGECCTEQA